MIYEITSQQKKKKNGFAGNAHALRQNLLCHDFLAKFT